MIPGGPKSRPAAAVTATVFFGYGEFLLPRRENRLAIRPVKGTPPQGRPAPSES
jgi:hypothetical protein